MMFFRLLNMQGIAGLAVGAALAVLLVIQKVETRHWRKQADQYQQLYIQEQAALAGTIANYRAAAEQARAADEANAARVRAEQARINQETSDAYEKRLAAARAAAERLRREYAQAHSSGGGTPSVPGISTPAGRSAQGSSDDGFSVAERLTATEQAIQLDELIKWIRAQHAVDPNSGPSERP